MCLPGYSAKRLGSLQCSKCIVGTFAKGYGTIRCRLCPLKMTTAGEGATECILVPIRTVTSGESAQKEEYLVVIGFQVEFVIMNRTDLTGVDESAGLDGDEEEIILHLIRVDCAKAFGVSTDVIQVPGLQLTSVDDPVTGRRRLHVATNVTATLAANITSSATDAEIDAALEVTRLSADSGIATLATSPDDFFEKTTEALNGNAYLTTNVTTTVAKPPEPEAESTFWDTFPLAREVLLGIAGGTLIITLGGRKAWQWRLKHKLHQRLYGKGSGRRGGHAVGVDMRPISQVALSKLARHKREKQRTSLDQMWERRIQGQYAWSKERV